MESGIAIHTISVGAGADWKMMKAVAFMTGGVHKHIDGGQTLDQLQSELLQTFSLMAGNVPPAKLANNQ